MAILRTRPRRARYSPEHALQRLVVQYLWTQEQQGRLTFFHVSNGATSRTRGAIEKALGVRAGVSDLVLAFPHPTHLYMELKAGQGRQSKEQKAFQRRIEALGYTYVVVRSLDEAVATTEAAIRRVT